MTQLGRLFGLALLCGLAPAACGDDDDAPAATGGAGQSGNSGGGPGGRGGTGGQSGTPAGAGGSEGGVGPAGAPNQGGSGEGAQSGAPAAGANTGGAGAGGATVSGGAGGSVDGGAPAEGGSAGSPSAGSGGDESAGAPSVGGNGPGECTSYVGRALAPVVALGRQSGWSARNRDANMVMFGCSGATTPLGCLTNLPLASDAISGANWDVVSGTHLRVLWQTAYVTNYRTRSSPDGRYLAHGRTLTGNNAEFIDLQRSLAVSASALYQPSFFPDGSGFTFAGTAAGAALCTPDLLASGTAITFTETSCVRTTTLGLSTELAVSADSGDSWAVYGPFAADSGTGTLDPASPATANEKASFAPVVYNGTRFVLGTTLAVPVPYQFDTVISGTARLFAGRLSDNNSKVLGYVVSRVDVTGNPGQRSVALTEVARYCQPGSSPSFSLDDRWLVINHHATDADAVDLGFSSAQAPAFTAYRGTSNLYLIDLLTGTRIRITRMGAGQNAVFPHFRSDGWIYFVVKSANLPEYFVASDAALVLGAG